MLHEMTIQKIRHPRDEVLKRLGQSLVKPSKHRVINNPLSQLEPNWNKNDLGLLSLVDYSMSLRRTEEDLVFGLLKKQ